MDTDRCIDDLDPDFEYADGNVSHAWLFNYPGKLMPDKSQLMTGFTKETYVEPPRKTVPTKGKRKKLLEDFYRQILVEEMKTEFDADIVVIEPYETDYSEHFKDPDSMPLPGELLSKNDLLKTIETCPDPQSKPSKIEELKEKYPLYASTPFTFTAQMTGRNRFGVKTTITKRPEENYDNIEY